MPHFSPGFNRSPPTVWVLEVRGLLSIQIGNINRVVWVPRCFVLFFRVGLFTLLWEIQVRLFALLRLVSTSMPLANRREEASAGLLFLIPDLNRLHIPQVTGVASWCMSVLFRSWSFTIPAGNSGAGLSLTFAGVLARSPNVWAIEVRYFSNPAQSL